MALFVFFSQSVHLLGDGYVLLATYGGSFFIHKWAEPGSSLILRLVQLVQGGYTPETALRSFQLFSYLGGALTLLWIGLIARLLGNTFHQKLFVSLSLVLSGVVLFFFGYVEYYPFLAALLLGAFYFALEFCINKKYIWLALLFFSLAVGWHLMALIFLPGFFWLLLYRFAPEKKEMVAALLAGKGLLLLIGIYIWGRPESIQLETLLLPFLEGYNPAADYTLFSLKHLFDLINELIIVIPGVFILLVLIAGSKHNRKIEPVTLFLGLSTFFAICFYFMFGAAQTIGRDWDIMAIPLIPLLLLLTTQAKDSDQMNTSNVASYGLILLVVTGSFCYVNIDKENAEKRYYTQLNDYNRNMWVGFGEYLHKDGQEKQALEIMKESYQRFPHYVNYKQALRNLQSGKFEDVNRVAHELVNEFPREADFLQLLGHVKSVKREYSAAESLLVMALELKPYSHTIRAEYSQLLVSLKKYDSALLLLDEAIGFTDDRTHLMESKAMVYRETNQSHLASAIADSMLKIDSCDPSGYLIRMMVSLKKPDISAAYESYKKFKEFGSTRPDYPRIVSFYDPQFQKAVKNKP